MSLFYPMTGVHPRVWINKYPNPQYTNVPFYVHYPYYTNNMIYNYSPTDPFSYTYGLESPVCRCDVFHTLGECLAQRNKYGCP